jgi:cyclic pyranopterin phosphate synthase
MVDFIASLAEISGLTDISLTTNGILLAPFAVPLFNAGMKRINISLDSLNEAKYARITRGGELNAVLRGIEAVYQAGFDPIKINAVVIKGVNDDEIIDFARLTLEKPFQIRFIELMPMGQVSLGREDRFIANDAIMEQLQTVYRFEPDGGNNSTDGPARMFRIEDGLGKIGFISPISHLFCESCNRLRLTADGRLRACLLHDQDVDLRDALRNGCDDGELERLMRGLIAAKPGKHELDGSEHHVKKCAREMSAIGG